VNFINLFTIVDKSAPLISWRRSVRWRDTSCTMYLVPSYTCNKVIYIGTIAQRCLRHQIGCAKFYSSKSILWVGENLVMFSYVFVSPWIWSLIRQLIMCYLSDWSHPPGVLQWQWLDSWFLYKCLGQEDHPLWLRHIHTRILQDEVWNWWVSQHVWFLWFTLQMWQFAFINLPVVKHIVHHSVCNLMLTRVLVISIFLFRWLLTCQVQIPGLQIWI
jgi:hypothetical protein